MSRQFSDKEHRDSLLRRRIKFVVEKGSIARLFKKGSSTELQKRLFQTLLPEKIAGIKSQDEYDSWLRNLLEDDSWASYSRNGLPSDRWGYFAKLINIVVYEIVSNRELIADSNWQRLRSFIHVPLDSNVFWQLEKLDPDFPSSWVLQDMTSEQYWKMQKRLRELAAKHGIPPIWFDDAWSDTSSIQD